MSIRERGLLDPKALTKIQSIILISIIVVAAVGVAAIVLWDGASQSSDTIKIGLCIDMGRMDDGPYKGALLATEQINAEGGILGKKIELIAEDTDYGFTSFDLITVSTALNRLLHYHKVDFVIGGMEDDDTLLMQDIIAENKKIFASISSGCDLLTQRVLDDYDKYKYFFRAAPPNNTALSIGYADSLVALREYTGLNKIAYLIMDLRGFDDYVELIESLQELHGFEVVYGNRFPSGTIDFSSYFAAAEAAGAEILVPMVYGDMSFIFIKEWYDRQSPLFIWGSDFMAASPTYFESTDGKCAHETFARPALSPEYPVSNKSLPFLEDYMERWGAMPDFVGTAAYEFIRYILPDALERAGTVETESVIKALEEVDIETPTTPRFVFTSSHDIMYGKGYNEQYFFQWKPDGTSVPVYPRELKEEAGATLTFPDWPGPWDNIN
jgi:branched-chain amino acid transport system substrate-binding protein